MGLSLLRLYNLREAGVPNSPTKEPRKRRPPSVAGNVTFPDEPPSDDEEGGDDDVGPEMDYDDPSPPEAPAAKAAVAPERPAPSVAPFAGQSAKPSKALQGGQPGINVSADKATLKALAKALNAVKTNDDDLADWVDDCIREIERSARSGDGTVTLPKFEATPDLDSFDDDGGSEDEEY